MSFLKTTGDLVSAADWNSLNAPLDAAEVTSGTEASLTLSVPAFWTGGLRVVGFCRTSAAVVTSSVTVGLDGVSGTNAYRQLRHVWTGTTPASASEARTSNWASGECCPGSSASANEFGGLEVLIVPHPNRGSADRTTAQWQGGAIPTTTTADFRTVIGNGRAVGANFTSITVAPGSGSFVAGTRFELWRSA